jgi:hypothetical protein
MKSVFAFQDITNTLINIPWGVEVTWAILTPKNITSESMVQNRVLGSIYSKPNSKKIKSQRLTIISMQNMGGDCTEYWQVIQMTLNWILFFTLDPV